MIFSTITQLRGERTKILAVLVILITSVAARGQVKGSGIDDDPGSGMRKGTNTIIGQVVYPSGRQVERRCTVRLSSVAVGEFSTMTDDSGAFTFRRLREGSDFITVEGGKEFLPAQETVDLFDNRGRTTTVQIQLRARSQSEKSGVVNAALATVPRPALQLYNKAMTSAAANDNKKAVGQLKGAIALYPEFVLALNELSILYINLGEPAKAVQALRQAVGIQPNNATLRLNLGYLLMQLKDFVAADVELQKATEIKNDYGLAHLYRGRVLVSLRKFAAAETELLRVIELAGTEVTMAYRYLGALYTEEGENAKAIAALEKYLAADPTARDTASVQEIVKQLKEQQQSKPQP
jgi:predicted Zn-dependent protease